MSSPHKIALVGFSSFERSTFESFFRLAARRPPGYLLVADASEANLAVVNADDPATLRAAVANKPSQHVMLIGATDGGTGWSNQKRPLNLMKVLTTVEQLLNGTAPQAQASSVPTASAAAPTKPLSPASATQSAASGFAPTQPPSGFMPIAASAPSAPAPVRAAPVAAPAVRAFTPAAAAASSPAPAVRAFASPGAAPAPTAPSAVPAAAPADAGRSRRGDVRTGAGDFSASRDDALGLVGSTRPIALDDEPNVDHILVVDDSDIALKFMRNRLTRFGFRTDLVNSGEEALGRLGQRAYKFVFLDVMMEGLDGYQTCRGIKQRKYPEGKPPVVVMLTSRGGTIDKIRGTLAGCDAYLTKPLNERDLIAVLAKHDRTVARGFQETNFGASGKSSFSPMSR
jgi:two-component system, cell cycle response regulator